MNPESENAALRHHPVEPEFGPSGIAVLESHHGPEFQMDWRCDPYPKLLLILDGAGKLRTRSESIPLSAQCMVIIPKNEPHQIEDSISRPLSLVGLCLAPQGFPDQELIKQACGSTRLIRNEVFLERGVTALRQMLYEARGQTHESHVMLQAMTAQMLVAIIRTGEDAMDGLGSAEQRVKAYADELIHAFWARDRMDTVARRLGISRRRFSGLFREVTGGSWLDRVHQLRLEHAAKLLGTTNSPVKAIAFECGYDDLSHFYRRFTARFGRPPIAWRQEAVG